MPYRILLKTTIGSEPDDWHIGRFSLLARHLASLKQNGQPIYAVTARDRVMDESGDDLDLGRLASGDFDQLWLIAADATGALTPGDVENIAAFRARGGGIMLTRDHQDLGASLAGLGPLGATQYFQSVNPDPDPARRCCDDVETPTISWPNFHSGANGNPQQIMVEPPRHPLVERSDGSSLQFLPAHPHEGAVGVPDTLRSTARVVARGRSLTTGNTFNLCVAVEEPSRGRAVADSSFHHFCDYNWDPRLGAPSFVSEPVGDVMLKEPAAILDTRRYVENIAAWLSGRI
jgi:hypothetical protein